MSQERPYVARDGNTHQFLPNVGSSTYGPVNGPWEAHGKSVKCVSHGKQHVIARCDSRGFLIPEGDEANARLVAAAPELLDALKSAKAAIEEGLRDSELLDWYSQIIAKAEGSAA